MIYSYSKAKRFFGLGQDRAHTGESAFFEFVNSLSVGVSLKPITQLDDLLLTDQLKTKAGYAYAWPAFSRLCTILASGASDFLCNLEENKQRDVMIAKRFGVFSDQFAADMFNRLIKYRFSQVANRHQLLVNSATQQIERLVGLRYSANDWSAIYHDTKTSLEKKIGPVKFCNATFDSDQSFAFYNGSQSLAVADRIFYPVYAYRFNAKKSLAFLGYSGLVDSTTGHMMIGRAKAQFMMTRTRKNQIPVLIDDLNSKLIAAPQVNLEKLKKDFQRLQDTLIPLDFSIENPESMVQSLSELVRQWTRDVRFSGKVARRFTLNHSEQLKASQASYLDLWMVQLDCTEPNSRDDYFFECGLYNFLTVQGIKNGEANQGGTDSKGKARNHRREGKYETREERDIRKTATRD